MKIILKGKEYELVRSIACVSYISHKTDIEYDVYVNEHGDNCFLVPLGGDEEKHFDKYKSETRKENRKEADLPVNLPEVQHWTRHYKRKVKQVRESRNA